MLKLHVVLAIDRAGLVGEDGETHHGVFDVGFLRQAPGMTVLCPASGQELKEMLRWAVNDFDGPAAIRYPRGGDGVYTGSAFAPGAEISLQGAVACHRSGGEIALVTYGIVSNQVLQAAEMLAEQGTPVTVLRLLTVSPLPVDDLIAKLDGCSKLIVVEEALTGSGIHEALAWELRRKCPNLELDHIDLGSQYVTHGSLAKLYEKHGLNAASIVKKVTEVQNREN